MLRGRREHKIAALLAAALLAGTCGAANAAIRIEGQVTAGGKPFANSTVTLWAASSGDPTQLAEVRAGSDGMFQLGSQETDGADVILYLTARGDSNNTGVTWLSVLGNTPPAKVVINELTTVASVWTNAQFLHGIALKGHPLGLRIAAGNVPSFVDLQICGVVCLALGRQRSMATTMSGFQISPCRTARLSSCAGPRRDDLLWHGQASGGTADRTSAAVGGAVKVLAGAIARLNGHGWHNCRSDQPPSG